MMERAVLNADISGHDGEEPPVREVASLLQTVHLVQSLHHHVLGVVKQTLKRLRIRDINETQALMLFNQGHEELKVCELRSHGHYFGSNVTHNLHKLIERGYLHSCVSPTDKRAHRVRLTPKGQAVHEAVGKAFREQGADFQTVERISDGELSHLNNALRRLERFWVDQVRYFL